MKIKKSKFTLFYYLIISFEVLLTIFLISNIFLKDKFTGEFLTVENTETSKIPIYHIPFRRISNNTNLYVELIPNIEVKFDGETIRLPRITTIKINSDGFRDRECSIEKTNNTFRIIALGDSLTFGFGVESNESWPKVLELKLNSINNEINYEVLNFGVPGQSIKNEVEMFKTKGLKYEPDIIIIGYTENDIIDEFEVIKITRKILDETPELKNKTRHEIYKDTFLHRKVINAFREGNQIVSERNKNKPFEEVFKEVETPLAVLFSITKNKTKVIIVAFPSPAEHTEALNTISNKYDWYFIDTSEIISKYPEDQLIIHPLDPHLTPFAYKIVGNKIFNYLIENELIPH